MDRDTRLRLDEDEWDQVRPEIALSWRRVRMSGLDPENAVDSLVVTDFDPNSQFMAAALPVLANLETKLEGTSYCVLLADRDCRIVHRWFDDRRVERILDDVGARPGSVFLEDVIGTNALGTAFEIRKGVSVLGDEHFIEPFKRFTCYGQPIRHPITRRIEGVLDITGLVGATNPLLAPLIGRAVEEIEQGLLDHARSSERRLLSAFQTEAARRQKALAAVGENLILTNRAALDLLQPGDYATLRTLVADPAADADREIEVPLVSGGMASVRPQRVDGPRGGVLFRIDVVAGSATSGGSVHRPPPSTARRSALLVSGAPGTGRTTAARGAARRRPITVLSNTTAVLECQDCWAQDFGAFMQGTAGTLCIEGIDQLPDRLLSLVVQGIKQNRGPELILTSGPRETLTGLARTIASMCVQHIDLPPLSGRGPEISQLAMRIVSELDPQARIRLTPSVLEALGAQEWPGNLHELRAVMTHVLAQRTAGDVALSDLPEKYRASTPQKHLAGLERAEREAILQALAAVDGNKVKAAKSLGISRTTLYARMRALRINTY